ncbi:MAG: UDP-3-O-acyl-N-acetylglucosamine deacetylase [Acidobacteriota bacterium]|nr:UDP-3-O-acyl-N-acetylglucosamine deacetylase [Acidobacteriota bacterium]
MNELILIVDDETGILTTLSQILVDEGYRTVTTASGEEALHLFREQRPDVVFLDIWLPDWDGLETLQALRDVDPTAMVIMMSGHGTSETAVKAIKMGAHDYLEKPLSYDRTVKAVEEALTAKSQGANGSGDGLLEASRQRIEPVVKFEGPPRLSLLRTTDRLQRTIRESSVIYGLGLHSGGRTGMVIQPLPPDTGIHFLTLPRGVTMPAHVNSVAETDYATSLTRDGESIRTVEHLLSALHACGVSNLLVKVHGEIPVLDGSALSFLDKIQEIGVVEQDALVKELVIDRCYEVGDGDKSLVIEPADVFSVSYQLSYPPPIGDQFYDFVFTGCDAYRDEIAPARTFGFMRDLKMINELGLGTGGRLDNFILVGEDNVINTDLRFPDEFVRHKILDIIGDLYLLGYPVRGKVTAKLTGHRDNIEIQRQILAADG